MIKDTVYIWLAKKFVRVASYGKPWMNFIANPISIYLSISYSVSLESSDILVNLEFGIMGIIFTFYFAINHIVLSESVLLSK